LIKPWYIQLSKKAFEIKQNKVDLQSGPKEVFRILM